ncbi:hypothetical protein [Tyzzerella sp. An114]|uniref:hypothetical protein n=1 Tax=Tyzzerella sp. An114 TaxID=1965545 RepID=UPI001302AA3E|nr:hypothetical protein [Tyzzerella sp. An114]
MKRDVISLVNLENLIQYFEYITYIAIKAKPLTDTAIMNIIRSDKVSLLKPVRAILEAMTDIRDNDTFSRPPTDLRRRLLCIL